MNSAQPLDSLLGKVKSGGMVRPLELADTYRKRSSVQFVATSSQSISENLKVKVQGIFLTSSELTAGTLEGSGHYFEGDSITIQAFPAPGFIFEGWEQNGNIISTSATYSFTSEFKNYTFKARFLEDLSDPDNDQFPNYAEAIYGSDMNNPNSDGDILSDYDEWNVKWYAPSLNLLEDDTTTITFLEGIIGADLFNRGELAGIEKGKTSVTSDPAAYDLVTKSSYDQALLDANISAEKAIADAKAEGIEEGKSLGKSEGASSVTTNPSAYNLVTKASFDQALLDANISAEKAIADAKVSAKAEGINLVKAEPATYNLVTKESFDQALLDANATADQEIADTVVTAKSEGQNQGIDIVKTNPSDFGLIKLMKFQAGLINQKLMVS